MAGLPISFLNGIINRQSDSGYNTAQISNGGLSVDVNSKALMSLLDSLSNGETIVGKILSQKDGMVQLLTRDNVTLNAEVGDGISLPKGTTALFEVNKGSDGHVALRPLYQNLASEETASTALKQAGLPVNDRSLEMVARNMEYGNPIDRNSLIKAYRDVALFPESPVKYITDLQKMDIPVTRANIEQYGAYLNMENSVSEAFSNIGDSIVEELSKALFDNGSEDTSALDAGMRLQGEVRAQTPSGIANNLPVLSETGDVSIPTEEVRVPLKDALLDPLMEFADSMQDTKASDISFSKDEIRQLANEFRAFNNAVSISELIDSPDAEVAPKEVLKAAIKDLKAFLESGQIPKETPEVPLAEHEVRERPEIPQALKQVLSRALSSQWALDKEDISQKGEVKELYNRLFEQSGKLLESLNNVVGKDSPVTANVQNLADNLQFMNSLNNFVPYIQIPFRTENGNTGSELYVYKNKRSLSDGDSELSAFIHLDMDALGPTDVYVRMKDSNVTTKFTLADDESLDLIHDNIDFLNRRLSEKGYSFKAEMTVDKQEPPIAQMMLNTTDRLYVSKTSFDARI